MPRSPSSRRAGSGGGHWLAAVGALVVAVATLVLAPGRPDGPTLLQAGGAALVGLLAEAAIWLQPGRAARGRVQRSAWVVPALLVLAGGSLLYAEPFSGGTQRLAGGAALLVLLALVLALQAREAVRGAELSPGARSVFSFVTYAVAFGVFAALYRLKLGVLLTALGGGVGAGLLALAILRGHGPAPARSRLHAALVALVLAQTGAGLSYWSSPALVGGALLLLVFYTLAGLSEAILEGGLDRRVVLEYGVVAAVGMALILSTAPWRA